MPGQQLTIKAIGSTNEAFCEAMLGRFASMIFVPNEQDFGIDFYCLPRRPSSRNSEMPVTLCGIQVKGESGGNLTFGGVRGKNQEWRRHELVWLRELSIPFYLAVVDGSFERVDLFSITRCLQVFWKTSFPFEISCVVSAPEFQEPVETVEPQAQEAAVQPTDQHDGKIWEVSLGSPFLSLKFKELIEESARIAMRDVLLKWIEQDRYSLDNLSLGVPMVKLPQQYLTNKIPENAQQLMFWNPSDGARANAIARRIGPAITCLVQQLLSEGRSVEVQSWKGALSRCVQNQASDEMGNNLLQKL